jgi:hypothetical protein
MLRGEFEKRYRIEQSSLDEDRAFELTASWLTTSY